MTQSEIRGPTHPRLLAVADALSAVDRSTKGSPANLLVPSGMTDVLRQWSYGQPTSLGQKAMAALDAPGLPEGLSSIFVAALRKFPKAHVDDALRRLDDGEDPARVWLEDGIGLEPRTGNPVAEIDDSRMKMVRGGATPHMNSKATDIIDHPELIRLNPEIENVTVRGNAPGEHGGSWDYAKRHITMPDGTSGEALDTGVHELQHMVQKDQNLPGGQDPDNFGYTPYKKAYDDSRQKIADALIKLQNRGYDISKDGPHMEVVNAMIQRRDNSLSQAKGAYDRYRNELGEAMARLTTKRRTLTTRERQEDYPFDPAYFERMTGTNMHELMLSPKHGGIDKAFTPDDLNAIGMTPNQYDFNKNPDYFRENKGTDAKYEDMSPQQYIDEALGILSGRGEGTAEQILAERTADPEYLDKLAEAIRTKNVAPPYLDYRSDWPGQEGLHRALAAQRMGMEKIPVQVIRDYKK